MYEQTDKLLTSVLHAEDVLVIAEKAVTITGNAFPEDEYTGKLINYVNQDIGELHKVLKRMSKNKYTVLKEEADKQRSDGFKALYRYSQGYSFFVDDSTKAEAAKTICALMEHIGLDTPHVGFDRKTVKLNLLIEEFNKNEISNCLAIYDGQPFAESLISKNNTFKELSIEKVDFQMNEDIKRKSDAKRVLVRHLTFLFSHLEFLTTIDPASDDTVIAAVNEVIGEVTAKAQARKTREEKEAENNDGYVPSPETVSE